MVEDAAADDDHVKKPDNKSTEFFGVVFLSGRLVGRHGCGSCGGSAKKFELKQKAFPGKNQSAPPQGGGGSAKKFELKQKAFPGKNQSAPPDLAVG